MQRKGYGGNLTTMVSDAKQPIDFDELLQAEDSDDEEKSPVTPGAFHHVPAMRIPTSSRPGLSTPFIDTHADLQRRSSSLGPELSPNTVSSNHAPSLVSDDGDYDDADDAVSHVSEGEDNDVAEIDIEGEVVVPVSPRKGKKGDKHVTFVSPMKQEKQ